MQVVVTYREESSTVPLKSVATKYNMQYEFLSFTKVFDVENLTDLIIMLMLTHKMYFKYNIQI